MRVLNLLVLILVFSGVSSDVFAQHQEQLPLSRSLNSLEKVLTINQDGSISAKVVLFEKFNNVPDDIINGTLKLTYKIDENKKIANLKIIDLKDPEKRPLERTSELDVQNCVGEYKIDLNSNTIDICTTLRSLKELHHELRYTYLQETTCKEEERVRQDIALNLLHYPNPYSVRISFQAGEGVEYFMPSECPSGWVKSIIPDGIICINDEFHISDPSKMLTWDVGLIGIVEEKANEIEEQRKIFNSKLHSLGIFLFSIFGIFGIQEYLSRRSRENPKLVMTIIIVLSLLYGVYLFWDYFWFNL